MASSEAYDGDGGDNVDAVILEVFVGNKKWEC